MTDSFNIPPQHDLESLTAYIHRLEEGRAADYGMLADHQRLLEKIEDRFTVLENAVKHRPFQVSVTDDIHGLTAYVHNLESLIHDTAKNLNRRLNAHREDIDALEKRVEQLEANQLRWFTEEQPAPEPQRGTSWHQHDVRNGRPVLGDERVVVMWRDGIIQDPTRAGNWNWNENGDFTIVAWRYAKEIK